MEHAQADSCNSQHQHFTSGTFLPNFFFSFFFLGSCMSSCWVSCLRRESWTLLERDDRFRAWLWWVSFNGRFLSPHWFRGSLVCMSSPLLLSSFLLFPLCPSTATPASFPCTLPRWPLTPVTFSSLCSASSLWLMYLPVWCMCLYLSSFRPITHPPPPPFISRCPPTLPHPPLHLHPAQTFFSY